MSKQIVATSRLEIDIDCRGCHTSEDPLCQLHSSISELNAHLETLILTQTCRCWFQNQRYDCDNLTRNMTVSLQQFVMHSCPRLHTISLTLNKAPSWQVHGPSLRHICLRIPPSTTIKSEYGETHVKYLYDSVEMCGMHSWNLPKLQTLFLQGLREPVDLIGIDFQDSETLDVINIHDCWIEDLSIPLFCKVFVSAQTSFLISHMDSTREHPLVSRANHVCLPTDLGKRRSHDGYSESYDPTPSQMYAMRIPDMFPAMRTLRMTWPIKSIGCYKYHSYHELLECFENQAPQESGFAEMPLYHMQGLSRRWQHVNLRELLIEGHSLGVTIPALPNLETLLVVCTGSVALDFADPDSLGRTITRMSVAGTQIHFFQEQRRVLLMALRTRGLTLIGDWDKCVAVHESKAPVPLTAELLEQARVGLACQCKACPSCLGVGQTMLDGKESCSYMER